MKLNRLLCIFGHKWEHVHGYWVVEKELSITKQKCARCHLVLEVEHIHLTWDTKANGGFGQGTGIRTLKNKHYEEAKE